MNNASDAHEPNPKIDPKSDLVAKELSLAEEARAKGNEGRARVCARRAAGIIIAQYLERRGLPDPGVSVIDRLRFLESLPEVSSEVKQIVRHLSMHVTPEYSLPVNVDLIEDTRRLKSELLENRPSRRLASGGSPP
jgi:hypothetical protein